MSLDNPGMIVAHGRVRVTDSTMVIGGTRLGKKFVGVCFEDVMKEDEDLCRPYTQYETIGDAVGAIIAWPIKLVNYWDEVSKLLALYVPF